MQVPSFRCVLGIVFLTLSASLTGCGNEEIKLKEAPPTAIGASKNETATKNQAALRSGAPVAGSSAGMNHNPSETPSP